MPAEPQRVYFDANVFLAYVGNEEGRADTVQALLDEARRVELEILTSVLTIAEVAYGAHERDAGLTEASEEAIDQLWTPASPVMLVDVSQAVTRRARTLIRTAVTKGLTGLRGADAVTWPQLACSGAASSLPTKRRRAAPSGRRSARLTCWSR